MTILGLLLLALGIVVCGALAYWLITKFLPSESHKVALAIVGVALLVVLLLYILPGALNQRVW